MLENMDSDVLPCENFYKFMCGSYVTNTVLEGKSSGASMFSKLTLENYHDMSREETQNTIGNTGVKTADLKV